MRTLEDILRRAKRLKRDELSRLIKQLDEHLASAANGNRAATLKGPNGRTSPSRAARPRGTKKLRRVSYARTLALSGTVHSGLTDVSSHKGKYLAEAYAARRET
jgi:hypothetical protein